MDVEQQGFQSGHTVASENNKIYAVNCHMSMAVRCCHEMVYIRVHVLRKSY